MTDKYNDILIEARNDVQDVDIFKSPEKHVLYECFDNYVDNILLEASDDIDEIYDDIPEQNKNEKEKPSENENTNNEDATSENVDVVPEDDMEQPPINPDQAPPFMMDEEVKNDKITKAQMLTRFKTIYTIIKKYDKLFSEMIVTGNEKYYELKTDINTCFQDLTLFQKNLDLYEIEEMREIIEQAEKTVNAINMNIEKFEKSNKKN